MGYYNPYFLGQIGCNSDGPWDGLDLLLEMQVIIIDTNFARL